jgi:maltooligosyltrehalose trehalohydrolase
MTSHKNIGLNFNAEGIAIISVWAPNAETLSLLLDNRKVAIPLEKVELGYWELLTSQIKPGDDYFLLVDDKELPDPASLFQPEGVHGPSQAVDIHKFEWANHNWKNPDQEEYIIYELHTGTFSAEGNFEGVASKLDHLIELGITAIEIMPVAQFPGERNWGYDGVFPFAVQNSYGGPKGLMQLVNICHQKGLAVILDAVYNHIGPEGNYLPEFGDYFTDKYKTPWGNAINFDDANCDAVRNFYTENALMWFRDFHVDALRLDAVHAIKDFSPKHILQEIKEEVDKLMALTGKSHYLMVELDLNDHRFINPIEKCGFGMDAQWIDEFHHALRVTAGGERDGYYSDFNGIADLAKSYRDAYVFDGIFSPQRLKTFGNKVSENPGKQFIAFSQNHDQVGNRMLGERSSQLFDFEMQKLMVGAVMVSPYLPLLFMGEEWSAQSPFQYIVSHGDPELIKAVQKGRKEEFAAFHAEGEAPDPQAEETFNRSKLNWDELKVEQHKKMLDYYKALIALRKELPALKTLNRKNLIVNCDEAQQTLSLERWQDEQRICCVMNFSKYTQPINLPGKDYVNRIFDSADSRYNGPGLITTQIQPQSLIIYTN